MIREARIPTLIGLFLLVLGIAAGVFLIQNRQIFRLAASPEETPKDVRITNISDSGFSVSWITDKGTTGFVSFGTSTRLGQTASDDQDRGSEPSPRIAHHVTLAGLAPSTTYFFNVGSGRNTFDNKGSPWQIRTAPKITTPLPPTDVIFGKVETQAQTPAVGVIVYVSVPGVTPSSSVTTLAGNWSISLATARSEDLSTFASYDKDNSAVQIFVQAGAGLVATASAITGVARPLPPIILGQTHDFRNLPKTEGEGESPKTQFELTPQASPSAEASPSSGFSFEPLATGSAQVKPSPTIDNPKPGEEIATIKPEFRGKGPSGLKITITVESPQVYSTQLTIGGNGAWNWTPTSSLEPGEHTITLSWVDETGKKQTIIRSFTVLAAADSLPSFTATPSGVATPTATPSARVSMPSTEEGVPVAGNLTATFAIFIMGLGLVFAGTAAFIFKLKVNA